MLRIATSSWTLHDTLGRVFYEHDGQGGVVNKGEESTDAMSLLDLPAFVAKDGIRTLEVCHFYFPTTEDSYLAELKAALDEADVELANVLVDTGNLSNPNEAERQADIQMTKSWQDVAVKLDAKGTRIDCGLEPPTPDALSRSASSLQELYDYGAGIGLDTATENWRTTSKNADDLLEIMRQADRPLKLCVDFGNAAKTENKYETMAALLPQSTSLHCKGIFSDGELDTDEFRRCLSLTEEAGFDGHIALIYDQFDNEWEKVLRLKEEVEAFYPGIS
ncbi:sugar phosphate isomerase/epimerase [Chloroflexi bacterium TSY]|nr:sugar phosphate isomerase/epimerase [Chloroflexi bacterium TSY]